MKALSTIAISLATVTLLAGCAKSTTNTTTNATTTPVTTPSTSPSGTVQTGSKQGTNLTVTMTEYGFAPKIIEVIADAENTLTIKNEGSVTHTFTVPDLGINEQIPAGGSQVVTVSGVAAGTYDVQCTVAGHKELGMEAQIFAQ